MELNLIRNLFLKFEQKRVLCSFMIWIKFFTIGENLGISLKCVVTKFDFLRLVVFNLLQFQVNNSSFTLELPFCQYCDKRLTSGKLA